MIPIRDAIPSPTRPIVTLALVAACASVMLVSGLLPTAQPGIFPPSGVGEPGGSSDVVRSLWAMLSLVRPSGWFQGVACAFALWIFGPTVEDRLGHGRFVVLYAGCAVVAAAVASAIGRVPLTSLVLPPAAVGGVIGAHAALYPKARILVLIPAVRGVDVGDVPAVLVAGLWMVAHLADSVVHGGRLMAWSPRLALVPVVAGILSGAAAAFLLKRPERMCVEWWNP